MVTKEKAGLTVKELKKLRNELWVVAPFFLASLVFFLGSFQFKRGAGAVPMAVGAVTAILTGMRLYHIIFPRSRIGEFREEGLAGEFDHIREEIEAEALKGPHEEPKGREVAFADERKAFIGLIGCFFIYLLLGYIVGSFVVILACSYYYGYKEKFPIILTLVSLFIVIYLVLYKILEAPSDFGMLLEPLLNRLNLI